MLFHCENCRTVYLGWDQAPEPPEAPSCTNRNCATYGKQCSPVQ